MRLQILVPGLLALIAGVFYLLQPVPVAADCWCDCQYCSQEGWCAADAQYHDMCVDGGLFVCATDACQQICPCFWT